jgi:hypothetical protein
MRTKLFFSAMKLSESDIASAIAREPGDCWLTEESRGVIDTVNATVVVELAQDISPQTLGVDEVLQRLIEVRLGEPWRSVVFVHVSSIYGGSGVAADNFLKSMQATWTGVVFDGDKVAN